MKRILWLAWPSDEYNAQAYRRRPKRVVVEKGHKAGPCNCVPDCDFVYDEARPDTVEFDGDPFASFCEEGLNDAGIEIKSGQLLKLTINVEAK